MSVDNPLITVYITNYNYEKYVKQSIDSVLSQTLQDFELIIIDDGSTDNSRDIIEEYRAHEKVIIIYQQNKGLNITNNVAMRVSKGKYLMRLDADDFLVETALEDMSAMLEVNEELGLVFPDYYYVDAEGHVSGEERRHNFEKEVSLYDQPAHGACTMIRLSFLKRIGGYNESFTCQDGYDLWLKFVVHYKVSNINKPLFYYRRHGENLTSNEVRILETRRAIKEAFLQQKKNLNSTVLVIPVRNTRINGESWPLFQHFGKTILEQKLEICLQAKCTAVVYIVSSDPHILDFSKSAFNEDKRVQVLERAPRLAEPNQSLGATVKLAVDDALEKSIDFNYVMTVTLDFPFADASIIDEAVNTLMLFKSDAVLSVRPDNQMYYQHLGHSLVPILDQEKFIRIERDALYKAAAGVSACKKSSFLKYGKINAGVISHVVVDEKMAFKVDSDFSFKVFKNIKIN